MNKTITTALLLAAVAIAGAACKKAGTGNAGAGAFPPNASNTSTAQPATANAGQAGASQPTAADKSRVEGELAAVLREYSAANVRGDKEALRRIFADDFNARYENKSWDKETWIGPSSGGIPGISTTDAVNIEVISLTGDTATVHYDSTATYADNSPSTRYKNSATLVKRDGRWQIKSLILSH